MLVAVRHMKDINPFRIRLCVQTCLTRSSPIWALTAFTIRLWICLMDIEPNKDSLFMCSSSESLLRLDSLSDSSPSKPLVEDSSCCFSSFFIRATICSLWCLIWASFSRLYLASLSNIAFMFSSCSSTLVASITVTDIMTELEDLVADWATNSFGDATEKSVLV